MLLEAAADVEVDGVPIVLLDELPCVVVVKFKDVSDVVVSVDIVVPSDVVDVLLVAAVAVV